MKKKLLLTSILTLSLAIGVGAVAFSSENKKEANADTQYEGGVTYLSSVKNAVIDTHDDTESEIKTYYNALNNLSESERRGQNLLKHLKPILQNESYFVNYDNVRNWVKITDRDWIQSPLPNPSATYTWPNDEIRIHALYRTDNGESTAARYDGSFGSESVGANLNREHTWAKSRGFHVNYASNAPGTDLHHLIIADNGINSTSHSNYPYGDALTPTINPSSKVTDIKNTYAIGYRYRDTVAPNSHYWFEPQDQDKGDIARAQLYMVARYNNLANASMAEKTVSNTKCLTSEANLVLTNMDGNNYTIETEESLSNTVINYGDLSTLLRWHKLDPVSDYEIRRNNLIDNNCQHNRNPFIDYPEWVDYIWGDSEGYAQPNTDTISQYGKTGAMTITGNNTVVINDTETLDVNITGITGNNTILWSSSDENVATINSNGVVTGLKEGTTTIKAITKDSTFYAEKEIEITENPTISVTGVSLNKSSTTIDVDGSETLTATVTPNDATNKNVSWSSSNTNVATVNGGTVTAVAPGSATITVTTEDGGFADTCEVTVPEQTVHVTGVSLDKHSLSLIKGDSVKLVATIEPDTAEDKAISWSSSNTNTATIDTNGIITTKNAGSTTITVTTNDGGFTDTCEITVTNPVAPASGTYELSFNNYYTDSSAKLNESNFLNGGINIINNNLAASVSSPTNTCKGINGVKMGTNSSTGSFVVNVVNDLTTKSFKSMNVISSKYGTDTGKINITIGDKEYLVTPGTDYSVTFDEEINLSSFTVETTTKRAYLKSISFTEETTTPVNGISLNKDSTTIYVGGNETLTATISPETASNKNVTWKSNNENVATVDNGVVSGVGKGTAIITATTVDGGFTATCNVTVEKDDGYTSIEDLYDICAELNTGGSTSQEYKIKGTVTGVYSYSFFIQQNGYAMYIYNTNITGNAVGKVVEVTATFQNYYGQYETKAVSSAKILDEAPEQINPTIINSNSDFNDKMQNTVISLTGLTYSSGSYTVNSNSYIVFKFGGSNDTVTYASSKFLNDNVEEQIKEKIDTVKNDSNSYRINLIGVHYVANTSGSRLNLYSADQIVLVPNGASDKQLVQSFVSTYMHMTDYDPTLSGEGDNSCLGLDGYYMKAKKALTVMSDEQINIFRTDSDFANAKARYEAWADAYGDSTPYETDVTPSNLLKTIEKGDAFVTTIIIISSLSAMALMFVLVLKKKKYE